MLVFPGLELPTHEELRVLISELISTYSRMIAGLTHICISYHSSLLLLAFPPATFPFSDSDLHAGKITPLPNDDGCQGRESPLNIALSCLSMTELQAFHKF